MNELPVTKAELESILSHFKVEKKDVTDFCDSSRDEEDIRWNFIFGKNYVLKIHSANAMWEERLQEISRLIARYRSIGIYCPAYICAGSGALSYTWAREGRNYTCFVEEYAQYPAFDEDAEVCRKEVVEHLGLLTAKYTDVDLSETRSMWSIFDLSPFDAEVDEKQENADTLVKALTENGYPDLAGRVAQCNDKLRAAILPRFKELPRCVFQGDLNNSNELHDGGRFVGLIDFNCSGTDVNINVFINETNWFPEETDFDTMSVSEILEKMDAEQRDTVSVILKHYTLSALEKQMYPYFSRIVDLFQYSNVCAMTRWLTEESRREKCAALIGAMADRSL